MAKAFALGLRTIAALLDNFNAVPPQVRDGIKATLGAFALAPGKAAARSPPKAGLASQEGYGARQIIRIYARQRFSTSSLSGPHLANWLTSSGSMDLAIINSPQKGKA